MSPLADLDIEQAAQEWRTLNSATHEAWNYYLGYGISHMEETYYCNYRNQKDKLDEFFARIGIDEKTFIAIIIELGLNDEP